MARHRLDISYGYDDMSQVGYWAPETPEFLEKREERRAASRSYAVSYTQAKANIRRISVQNQANSPTRRQTDSYASIIDFERLDRSRYRNDSRNEIPEREAYPSHRPSASSSRSYRSSANEAYFGGHYENDFEFDDPMPREDTSLRGRVRKAQHDWRSRKADRAFTRDYEDVSTPAQEGSRAAVYRGKMGRTHQRAARMQQTSRTSSGFQMPAFLSGILDAIPLERLSVRPVFIYSALALMCAAFFAFNVFPAAQDLYLQSRANDQLAAEYQAVLDRNAELEQHVAALQTDEGMEELAHESLGWVKEGEHSVSILTEGSANPGSDTMSDTGTILEGSVPAPETWYSPVLDVVFGYEG
ncbi:MAG: septum formation initiator family protein [Coriobacteriia bacterium]|nr:septum formation initiator family protein [Coriobacteriia bacterium]